MKELKCPHCHQTFAIDESKYAELLNQVKTDSFNEELDRRVAEIQKTQDAEHKAALAELRRQLDAENAEKDKEIECLRLQITDAEKSLNTNVELAIAKKEQELTQSFATKEQEFNNLLHDKENKIGELKARILQNDSEKQMAVMEVRQNVQNELQKAKDEARDQLKAKEDEIIRLQNEAQLSLQKSQMNELALRNEYEATLRKANEQHKLELNYKDELIAQYKDFKAKQSTKMIGESLEVYCNNQFMTLVSPYLPSAKFCKDNDVIDHTKGDFIFRDYVDGVESVSIMFEMKNEADDTQVKHKNADFFKKLDADRTKKNCEYAVLVSLLELDNDLYNNGIYAVPEYEKMYVVRPQQFLTIISLLVQTGRNTAQVKKELADAKNREIDVTNFEEKLDKFKSKFGGHVEDAAKRYNDALNDIDNAIEQLTKMKEHLRLWVDHLYKADKNLEDITIRKLTYQNPTMKAKFDEAREATKGIEVK